MENEKFDFKLGNFEIKILSDYTQEGNLGLDEWFPDADSEEIAAILNTHGLDAENMILSFNCIYVDTGDHKILIDTGSGKAIGGKLLDHLGSESISFDSIDQIIFTHGHPDHIGGVTDAEGELVFSNAEYWMWAEEWEYWQEKSNIEKEPPHAVAGAEKNLPAVADKLTLIREEDEFLPGISAMHAPGHTIGLMAVILESEGEKMLIAADSFQLPFQIEHYPMFGKPDRLPELVESTRKKILDYVVENNAKLHVYHFPHPGLGVVRREDGVFKWEAIG